MSHHRLTRMLPSDGSGHPLLEVVCRTLFVGDRGWLIIDETVRPKPFATAIENVAWGYSRQAHTPVYGLSLGLLGWTNGRLRLPLGIRLWHHGGPSTYAWALELLRDARHRRRCRPDDGLFDACYPSKALLKRMRDEGWDVVCRLKKHRRFNGAAGRASRRHPYWSATGRLTGGLTVLVVRYGATYYAPTRLTLSAAEVRRLYRLRTPLEEVIRVCQAQFSLSGCQARSERAPLQHITGYLAAFCVLERDRHDRGLSIDKRRRALSCNGQAITLPALERLRRTA